MAKLVCSAPACYGSSLGSNPDISKTINRRHKQRSGQHTLARQKKILYFLVAGLLYSFAMSEPKNFLLEDVLSSVFVSELFRMILYTVHSCKNYNQCELSNESSRNLAGKTTLDTEATEKGFSPV